MRALLASTALALLVGLSPASAAMCGGGSSGSQQAASGGMCGGAGSKQMSEWPQRDAEGKQETQKQSGMCGCCKEMAILGGGTKGDDPHKGMDMPKQ
jgi:hypothetical protein